MSSGSGTNDISNNIIVSHNAADQSQQGSRNNTERRKSSAKQLSRSRQEHKRSYAFNNDDMESPEDDETNDEESDSDNESDSDEKSDSDEEPIKRNKKRTYSRTLVRSEFLQPLDHSRDELRKRRKSLLIQRDEDKRKKTKSNSNDKSSGKGKFMKCSTSKAEDRAIQDRALAEIIALDGKYGSIKKVIEEYNRLGHSCVKQDNMEYRLKLLRKGKTMMQPNGKNIPDIKALVSLAIGKRETSKEILKAFPEVRLCTT